MGEPTAGVPQSNGKTSASGDPRGNGEVLSKANLGGLKTYRAREIRVPECVMIFGDAAVGKTPLIASANNVEHFGPILIINADRGAKSLSNLAPDVEIVDATNFANLQKIFDTVRRLRGAGFKSIALDGSTTTQDLGIDHLYYQESANTNFLEPKTATITNQGWSSSKTQMRTLINAFKALQREAGVHLFFTAWADDDSKPNTVFGQTNPPYWVPSFTPAARKLMCGAFDSILFMRIKNGQRVLQTQNGPEWMARDRGDRLPAVILDPTMQKLADGWGYTFQGLAVPDTAKGAN